MWQLEADAQHAQGGCWVLTNHPFISGRPSRARALEQLIEGVKALDGMWVTTLEEIARHAATVTTEVRTHTRYDVPAFPDAPVLRDGVPVGGSGQARERVGRNLSHRPRHHAAASTPTGSTPLRRGRPGRRGARSGHRRTRPWVPAPGHCWGWAPPSRAETTEAVSATLRARTSSMAGGTRNRGADSSTAATTSPRWSRTGAATPTSSTDVRPSLIAKPCSTTWSSSAT